MSLGEVLVTLRRARDVTQETLAESAGVTQAALSRYERGRGERFCGGVSDAG